MKRAFDLFISLTGLIVLFPILIPVMIILKFTGEHYILYFQPRVGKKGRIFNIIKFSTMLKDSPNIGTFDITVKNDPRIFPFGHFLRRTKINEIPQLFNVLIGDMSMIGPRPLTQRVFDFYSPEQQKMIIKLKPGLSGVGSIIFREEATMLAKSKLSLEDTFRQLLNPHKATLEKWYLENQTFWVDIKILCLTILSLFNRNTRLPYKWLKELPELPDELRHPDK